MEITLYFLADDHVFVVHPCISYSNVILPLAGVVYMIRLSLQSPGEEIYVKNEPVLL